jgi:IQ calmodulin-binding motif
LLAKELQQFLGLPDSNLVPGAGSALRALSTLRSKSAYAGPPEQSGHTDANPKSSLTDIENLRLKDLERRLHLQYTGKTESLVRRCSSRRAYQVANRNMKNIMNGHGPNALTKRAGSSTCDNVSILHSALVGDLYQRNRDERSAAIQLQAWWRHYSIRTKFELMARQGRLIVRIQALVRGLIYRKRIAEWYTQRLRMVTGWQRLIRRGLSNRRIARSRAAETVLIICIQALYRGCRDRSIVMKMRHAQAATTIQRVWRGAVGRVLADRLWLDINITPMQKVARGMLTRKAVAVYRSSRHSAAVTLQRCLRGYTARYQRAQAAVQRETDRRQVRRS